MQVKRVGKGELRASPNPLANGLIVDGADHRIALRMTGEDTNWTAETWWVYRLSTGQELGRYTPEKLIEPKRVS